MISPPFDLDAERATIGACLMERDAITAVSWLSPDSFYLERHAVVWRAVLACYSRREPPDVATVSSQLRASGDWDVAGGLATLGELVTQTPVALHVEYYAEAVARCARARALIEAGGQIAALGYQDAVTDPPAAFDRAEQTLFRVTQGAMRGELVGAGMVAADVFAHLSSQEPAALTTGLTDLDRRLIGWRQSRLYVVAARPGMGKTGFGLSALAAACRRGARVALFSLEMDRAEVGMRLAAGLTGISSQAIEARTLGEDRLQQVLDALGQIDPWPFVVSDLPGEHIAAIRAKARRAHAESPLDLVIVDYLQLAEADGEGRVQVVGAVARGLKNLARELRAPVLALAQLNRAVEARSSKVPQLSDLRESGEIEQAADAVLFIHRPEYYDPEDRPGVAELHIAKQRNGPLGVVPCRFDGPTTTFHNLAAYAAPEGY